jgi:hypothetical protein
MDQITSSKTTSSILNFILYTAPECTIHIANNENSKLLRQTNPLLYHELLEFTNLELQIPHTFISSRFWGVQHESHYTFVHTPMMNQKFVGCILFILVEPSPYQLVSSIEFSGYFIEPSATFLVYTEVNVEMFFPGRMFLSDVTIYFIQRENSTDLYTVGVFCYTCIIYKKGSSRGAIIPQTFSGSELETGKHSEIYKEINNRVPITVTIRYIWYMDPGYAALVCDPFNSRRLREMTCFPQGRAVINLLRQKHNLTIEVIKDKKFSDSLLYSPPYFNTQYPSIMVPGMYIHTYEKNLYSKDSLTHLFFTRSNRRCLANELFKICTLEYLK